MINGSIPYQNNFFELFITCFCTRYLKFSIYIGINLMYETCKTNTAAIPFPIAPPVT